MKIWKNNFFFLIFYDVFDHIEIECNRLKLADASLICMKTFFDNLMNKIDQK